MILGPHRSRHPCDPQGKDQIWKEEEIGQMEETRRRQSRGPPDRQPCASSDRQTEKDPPTGVIRAVPWRTTPKPEEAESSRRMSEAQASNVYLSQ